MKTEKTLRNLILITLVLTIFCSLIVFAENNSMNDVELYMFYGQGCPHCAKLKLFLDDMITEYPSLNVVENEVYQNNEGRELFNKMVSAYNTEIDGVPTLFIDDEVVVGYSNDIGKKIEQHIKRCTHEKCINPLEKVNIDSSNQNKSNTDNQTTQTNKINSSIEEKNEDETVLTDPFNSNKKKLGNKLTIPIVVSAAAIDAINPCAFAVLIILMTAALSIAQKKRALKFGLAFTISIYISYFLMGLGLFSALQASGLSHGFYIFVTVLAVIVGLLNIKDYFWYGKGFLMEVPMSWRPPMKKILRSATSPFGAFLVGFVVSLFELPCTGGPYIVILGLLAKEVTREIGIIYLLLYNLVFVSPLIVLSFVIYKGLSTTDKLEKIRQKRIRLLHLIAGILMLGIAIVMVVSLIKGWV